MTLLMIGFQKHDRILKQYKMVQPSSGEIVEALVQREPLD